jgi:hypothetical protein
MDLDLYDFNKSKAEVFLNRESKKPARIQSYPSAYIIATKLKEKLEDNDIPSTFFKAYTKNGYRTGEAACCSIRLSDAFYVKTKHGILNKGSVEIACNPENYRWQCYAELGGYYVDTNGITTGYHFTSRIQYNIVDTIEEFIDGVFNAIKKNARYGKINPPVIK